MSKIVFDIHRRFLLTILVLVSVLAFMPDTGHVGEDVVVHEVSDHSHDEDSSDDIAEKHCHSGVSCAGAMSVRDFAMLTLVRRFVESPILMAQFDKNSLAPEHEPPVPIVFA